VADVLQAFEDASALGDLGSEIKTEASQFRAYLAARLVDDRGVEPAQLARILGLTPARVSQLVKDGRKQRRDPMTDPGTLEEQPTVALAVVTSDKGVLMAHRKDGIPPWTFPGGEVRPGETAAAALTRKVPAETGIEIKPVLLFGRRIHPRTSRTMGGGLPSPPRRQMILLSRRSSTPRTLTRWSGSGWKRRGSACRTCTRP